ncbi:DUF1254 domain-containing protein [Vibrio kyushuensis]|uniref:DUF1254 domain-containing protein n=1 Tax=Vibrio kyushuensis TaxID=2910249 RepID=UPI003D0AD7E9
MIKKTMVAAALLLSFNAIADEKVYSGTLPNGTEVSATEAELHAYKAYHHLEYLISLAQASGGTNVLAHTRELPVDGADVVTPALDQIYSRSVLDLTNGPVVVNFSDVETDHYYSIQIVDQEHYTTYDEIRPVGSYVFVRQGYEGELPEGKVLTQRGDYPFLFIRTQVKDTSITEYAITHAIQDGISLESTTSSLIAADDLIKFTVETHSPHKENAELLKSQVGKFDAESHQRMFMLTSAKFLAGYQASNVGIFNDIGQGMDDPMARAMAIIGHLGLPEHHAYYDAIAFNCDGVPLNGSNVETVTLPYEPGTDEFWSVTRYSSMTRNLYPNQNDIFNSFNTKPDASGNVTITFSANDPEDGTYWMPVNENEHYYIMNRYYAPNYDELVVWSQCGEFENVMERDYHHNEVQRKQFGY